MAEDITPGNILPDKNPNDGGTTPPPKKKLKYMKEDTYTVYVDYYDDDIYHDTVIVPPEVEELIERVKLNKTKCLTLKEYWQSADDYDEYIEYLLKKYVPEYIIRMQPKKAVNILHILINSGQIKEFIPQEPMAIGKSLIKKVKAGIRWRPTVEYKTEPNPERRAEWLAYLDERRQEYKDYYNSLSKKKRKKLDKEAREEASEIYKKSIKKRKNMLNNKHTPLLNQVDILQELKSLEKSSKKKDDKPKMKFMISNMMKPDWYNYHPDCIEEMERQKAYEGSVQQRIDEENYEREVFTKLHEAGWDTYLLKRKMGLKKTKFDSFNRAYRESDEPMYVFFSEEERIRLEKEYKDAMSRDENGKKIKKKNKKSKDDKDLDELFNADKFGKKKKKNKKKKKKDDIWDIGKKKKKKGKKDKKKDKKKKKKFNEELTNYLIDHASEVFDGPDNPYKDKFTDRVELG